ncbi:MAG: N-acetylmuramoyl-L-alanine amidase family protein [Butyrivibrio sp.]
MKVKHLKAVLISSVVVLVIVGCIVVADSLINKDKVSGNYAGSDDDSGPKETVVLDPFLTSDRITADYLTVNPYSRPGDELSQVNAIVVHYVGNPGTTAAQNRNYFENLKDTHERSASSHYIIGLEGEIIQCVPLSEISYASNDRNDDTIAIENCHPDATGKFNRSTYDSLVELTAALCRTYGLNPQTDVIRHYDVTGKHCPLYYVENEDEWYAFKMAVENMLNNQ